MTEEYTELLQEMTSIQIEGIDSFIQFPNLAHVLVTLGLLWISKKVFDLFLPYSLEHQLVKEDNKAITIAFVGYLGGVVTILEGVLEGGSASLGQDLLDVIIWGLIGIVLLNLASKINDVLILKQFDNRRELLEHKNVAVGVVVASSYMASAFIIRSVIIGESLGWLMDGTLTCLYFIVAQLTFYLYGILYQTITKYDFHQEIKQGNAAAGISLGSNFVAMGILLAIPLSASYSFLLYLIWFVVGSSVMVFFRFVMDHAIIPSEKLDEEIHKDFNWGVAFMEGCFSISAVLVLQSIFA